MLNPTDEALIYQNAYVAEHLPRYLVPFAKMEPYCEESLYVYYHSNELISFIGYPLKQQHDAHLLQAALANVIKRHQPKAIRLIAPEFITLPGFRVTHEQEDTYSMLDIKSIAIKSKLQNMLNRAGKELAVSTSRAYTMEHHKLLVAFLNNKGMDNQTNHFFHRLPDYLAFSNEPLIVEGRLANGKLHGYNIVDFSKGSCCFYLFNITGSKEHYIPGTADLLLYHLIKTAAGRGLTTLNLGLSINSGIDGFKKKWGKRSLLSFCYRQYERQLSGVPEFFKSLFNTFYAQRS